MVQGYYDDALEFIRVERLQIIATMTPPGSVGRHALSTRFTARTRVLSMGYPSECSAPCAARCCAWHLTVQRPSALVYFAGLAAMAYCRLCTEC